MAKDGNGSFYILNAIKREFLIEIKNWLLTGATIATTLS